MTAVIALNRDFARIALAIVALLLLATVVGFILQRRAATDRARAGAANFNQRTYAWWRMVLILGVAIYLGLYATLVLFLLISFQALREFITLTPTRRGDHHALFWVFFVMLPLQYLLLAAGWVGTFLIFIPAYGFLFLCLRSALAGDTRNYLERVAKIYWAAMICIYMPSHAPALLILHIPGYENQTWKLLVFLIAMTQLDDVFQYCWGKLLGRRKLAPHISPNKTVEGFIGGVVTVTLVGLACYRMTPFTPLQSAGFAALIACLGTAGGLVMSAIKRDAGVKDYGQLIAGHGGVMDRIDSLTFAAPIFFHLVRFFFVTH